MLPVVSPSTDTAPDILLLHGANGCREEILPWCEALASVGFRTHAINLAGHGGRAIPAELTMEAFTEDVLSQLDRLGLRQPPIVMGYSFGGIVALHLARHHPARVRGVVGLATKYVFDAVTVRHFTHLLQVPRLTAMAQRLAHLQRVHHPNDWRQLVEALHRFFASLEARPPLSGHDLREIRCPALILSGTTDQVVRAEETQALHKALPRAGLAMFEGVAHPVEAVPASGLAKTIRSWSEREKLFKA